MSQATQPTSQSHPAEAAAAPLPTTRRTPAAPRHFLSLPQAQTVPTPALDAVGRAVEQTVAEQAIMYLYGDAGCGKTFALQTALTSGPGPGPGSARSARVCRLSPRPAPTPTTLRAELLSCLDTATVTSQDPGILDTVLRAQLATLVVEEAQRLTTGCFEYLCYLFDDPDTRLAIVFIAGTGGIHILRRQPMLPSRTAVRLQIPLLTPQQVRWAIPRFHPLWHHHTPSALDRLDARYGHGNFRRWAQMTHHGLRLLRRTASPDAAPDDLLNGHPPCRGDDQ